MPVYLEPSGPGASGKESPSTPNWVPALQLVAALLWGVRRCSPPWAQGRGSQQSGAGAARRVSSPIASGVAALPFIPCLSKPSRTPRRAVLCLPPATHGSSRGAMPPPRFTGGVCVSLAD